jgi:hypothetical protein
MLRISSETGGKLACRRDWLLHSLVVRREAPSSLRMIIRSIVEDEASSTTSDSEVS